MSALQFQATGLSRLHLGPIDFGLSAGETVCLSGPSGAGKTVLMRALADLDPNEGKLELCQQSRETIAAPQWRRQVCYLPADSGWWMETVGEHFPDPDLALLLLVRLKLPDDVLTWPIARLSTGEKQRLALARVLLLNPKVLLLDEPTSGLDAEATQAAEAEIKEHTKTGSAVLFVSHDAEQIARIADRKFVLANGTLSEVPS
jgi:putative ABC transport system ATP-binding protein